MHCVLTRYNSITRVNSDASRMPRHRRKSLDSLHKSLGRRSESISSSSSVSPASTHISLPSSFHHAIDLKPHYEMDQYSTWPTDALPPFRTTPMAFEYSTHPPSLSNPLIETGYKSRDLPMKHQSLFQDQSYMYTRPPVSVSNQQPFRHFADSPTTHSGGISNSKFQNLSQFTQDFNDVESQFSFFCGQAADVDTASVMGMAWSENMPTTPLPEPKPTTFCDFRHPLSHEAYSVRRLLFPLYEITNYLRFAPRFSMCPEGRISFSEMIVFDFHTLHVWVPALCTVGKNFHKLLNMPFCIIILYKFAYFVSLKLTRARVKHRSLSIQNTSSMVTVLYPLRVVTRRVTSRLVEHDLQVTV